VDDHQYRLIEQRLERIKYFGSLQLQELKRLYNRGAVIEEDYRAGKFVRHVHGLWHQDALTEWRLCLQVGGSVHQDPGAAASAQLDRYPMPIGPCEVVESTEPRIVVIWLKFLDQCDFFFPDTFEFRRNPTPESLWIVTNRKLQAFIDEIPSCGGKGTNQVIQGDDKMLQALANERSKIIERFGDGIVELMRVGARSLDHNLDDFTVSHAVYPFYEVHQAFFTLADPPMGLVNGHIVRGTPNSAIV